MALIVIDTERNLGTLQRPDQQITLVRVTRQGFLTEDMFAGPYGGKRERNVVDRQRTDRYRVDANG